MRTAIAAGLLVLVAGCRSSEEPATAPSSTPASIATSTPSATSLPSFRETWERDITAASPREKCEGPAAFEPPCFVALEKFATATDKLAMAATATGAKYANAGLVAIEVGNAARKWNSECITERPEVRNTRGCLPAFYSAYNGVDKIVAELYAAEQSK